MLWALRHFPLFWSGIWTPQTLANMWMFVVMITLLTILMSFVFNHAKGSLLITILMHATFNTFADRLLAPMFPAPVLDEYGLLPELIGFGVLAVIVIAATRGRLGYEHYHRHVARQQGEPTAVRSARPARLRTPGTRGCPAGARPCPGLYCSAG